MTLIILLRMTAYRRSGKITGILKWKRYVS